MSFQLVSYDECNTKGKTIKQKGKLVLWWRKRSQLPIFSGLTCVRRHLSGSVIQMYFRNSSHIHSIWSKQLF